MTDYLFYKTKFLGNIINDGNEFDACAVRALADIDSYTLGKASKNIDVDAVNMCVCAVAEQHFLIRNAGTKSASGELKSETVGSYSRSYQTSSDAISQARAEIRHAITQYLAPTGLLYGGVCACSHRTL